jgi:hypothetical protein
MGMHAVVSSLAKISYFFFSFSLSSGLLISNDSQVFYAHERLWHPCRCPYEAQPSCGHDVATVHDAEVAAMSCITRPPPTLSPWTRPPRHQAMQHRNAQ